MSTKAWIRSLAPVCAVALLLAGCTRATPNAPSTRVAETVTPPAAEASAPATIAPPASGGTDDATGTAAKKPAETEPKESGKQFGYVAKVAVSGGVVKVTVDYAQMLTGDAATTAATEHGEESPPPNDYFIVNDNAKLRTFSFASGAKVAYLKGGSPDLSTVSAATFRGAFEGAASDTPIRYNPYWIWLKDGKVTKMEQQYLP